MKLHASSESFCRRNGLTIQSTIDCAVAQTAIEHNLLLLHDDKDYEAIARVAPLRFYQP